MIACANEPRQIRMILVIVNWLQMLSMRMSAMMVAMSGGPSQVNVAPLVIIVRGHCPYSMAMRDYGPLASYKARQDAG